VLRITATSNILAAFISSVCVFFVDFCCLENDGLFHIADTFFDARLLIKSIGITFFVSALLSLISLFGYNNRKRQFVLGRINILINFYLLGVLLSQSLKLPGETFVSEKGIGVFLPLLVVVFLAMANRAIKRDEDLVKSVDRLR
jgi:predicted permease